jgi:hypothetical protein
MKLKSLLVLGSLSAASMAFAQAIPLPNVNVLVAGWDFNNLPNNTASSVVLGSVAARYSDISGDVTAALNPAAAMGTAYFNSSFGSTTWQGGNNGARGVTGAGTSLNTAIVSRPGGTTIGSITGIGSTSNTTVLAVNPTGQPGTPDRFSFVVDASYATGLSVSYAARTTSTGPTYTINWYYQVGSAGSPTLMGSNNIVTGNTYNVYTMDFSSVSSLNGASQAVLIADVVQTAGGTAQLFIDNAQIVAASAIPEPSTYAALAGAAALGLVVLRRRKQA